MLTAEKAHLLLTRPSGRSESPAHHRIALAAAALADLRRAGVVRVEDGPAQTARVWTVRAGTAGDAAADAFVSRVDGLSGRRVAALVAKGRPDVRAEVAERLTRSGDLVKVKDVIGGHLEPASDAPRLVLVQTLTNAVLGEAEPSEEDRVLIGLLLHLDLGRRLLTGTHERLGRRELVRRMDELSREDVLVQAVRRAVAGIGGAVAAAAAGSPAAAGAHRPAPGAHRA